MMMRPAAILAVIAVVLSFENASAATRYVDLNCANPTPPYTDWSTAATNIQDAINASVAGDVVMVTNGVYAIGGRVMGGNLTNRVVLDKALTVQSVNGPKVTVIKGAFDSATNGPASVRCAWMTNGAHLNGFTLANGATSAGALTPQASGGGVWGASISATLNNCIITGCAAYYMGGGAFQVTLTQSMLTSNHAIGSGTPGAGPAGAGEGGGAFGCNLSNCVIMGNFAHQGNGGGTSGCNLLNCAVTKNSSYLNGGGAINGTLTNCTVTGNISSGYTSGYGAAVYGASLNNCIVQSNFLRTTYPNTNYANCTLTYCCAIPLAPGVSNIAVDPQLLDDGVHLAATSPCRGAGNPGTIIGADIDGQPWANPPSIGCDEWQSPPVIATQAGYRVGPSPRFLSFHISSAGQTPFTFSWGKDSTAIQDDGHHAGSGTGDLTVSNFGLADAGSYQVIVSNSFGTATGQVQVVIHAVDANGQSPVSPYSTWATAATNIQDAIDAALAGDIVLVTNGVYATGGKVISTDLTNRVALDKPLTVESVNGFAFTIIQGARDPATTNGPLAVRCAYVSDGAVLSGFTLRGGATRGGNVISTPLQYGGGVWCTSTNAVVSNCELTNNSAQYAGGGASFGTLNGCLLIGNFAVTFGGGAYQAVLNNCTVLNNTNTFGGTHNGCGIYNSTARNCVVQNNFALQFPFQTLDNYDSSALTNCLTSPLPSGAGNIAGSTGLLDFFHIPIDSPCVGRGNALYATGTDLDGEPWANPPTIGCDEVIASNLVGPLSVSITPNTFPPTNTVASAFLRPMFFIGNFTGHATRLSWLFGDGSGILTNASHTVVHNWTNAGDFVLTFTAYNTDNPSGVSAKLPIHVDPVISPKLFTVTGLPNGFGIGLNPQYNVSYSVQYTSNLVSPVTWQTLANYLGSTNTTVVVDTLATNQNRFYRVVAQ